MRLGKKRTAPRSPECESLESYIQPRPEWPYYTAIRSAFIKRFARWYLSASGSRQLEKEWTTLATQLFRPTEHSKPRLAQTPHEPANHQSLAACFAGHSRSKTQGKTD
jgi:hypothetical protein